MSAAERRQFIESLDPIFEGHGFTRAKRSSEWTRREDARTVDAVHVNIGKVGVNPSITVRYEELIGLLPEELSPCTGTMTMWSDILGELYDLSTPIAVIEDDFLHRVKPYMDSLHSRDAVIRSLESEDVRVWPVPSGSFRMRLLPLMLYSAGRIDELRDVMSRFRKIAAERDQMLPPFARYADAIDALIA